MGISSDCRTLGLNLVRAGTLSKRLERLGVQGVTDVLDPCDPKLAGAASGGDAVVVLAERGVDGGPCYEHRGAAIHANVSGTAHKYHLEGMPGCEGGNWLTATTLSGAVAAIDGWINSTRGQ